MEEEGRPEELPNGVEVASVTNMICLFRGGAV